MLKQVIVLRSKYIDSNGNSFSLRRGKEISQCAHASMAFLAHRLNFSDNIDNLTPSQLEWLRGSFTKITVKVSSEEELMEIYEKAMAAKLEVHLITDSGKTEFHDIPTKTCLAIGPDEADKIDLITGKLQLL
jgi:PTH2 family peptidyl-tRNA hydrolase